jgi:hypothetical protein
MIGVCCAKCTLHLVYVELGAVMYFISKMDFSHWRPPGVLERMWSENLDASISGDYQTLGGNSGRPSE